MHEANFAHEDGWVVPPGPQWGYSFTLSRVKKQAGKKVAERELIHQPWLGHESVPTTS